MQHQKSEPYALIEYQSSEPRVFGVEVRPRNEGGLNSLLAALRWVGKSKAFSKEITFLVLTLPDRMEGDQIRLVAECSRAEGLIDKLCLVVPQQDDRHPTIIAELQQRRIRALLGGVGSRSRFSDLISHPIAGVVIDPQLVSNASGDPSAAAILDAVVGLAASLGLKSFATECATQSEYEFATSAGISYVAHVAPYGEYAADVVPIGARRVRAAGKFGDGR